VDDQSLGRARHPRWMVGRRRLGALATAEERNRSVFAGFAAFGLGDENAIAWHWADNLTSLVSKPNEPTFKAADYMARIAPLPFFMIQSSHDQYTPLDERSA
jgi:hypothetical protein